MGTGTSPTCQESQVRVWDQVRGYRYTNFCVRISITSTGIMGKGTTSLLSWALYSLELTQFPRTAKSHGQYHELRSSEVELRSSETEPRSGLVQRLGRWVKWVKWVDDGSEWNGWNGLTMAQPELFTAIIEKPSYRFVHEGRLCRIS